MEELEQEATILRLLHLEVHCSAVVESVEAGLFGEIFLRRLEAMGLVPGNEVRVLRRAWFGGPLVVRIGMTTEVAIRRAEAHLVRIRRPLVPAE